MNIGAGIVVIATGAVLAFAVNLPGGTVNVSVIGWIVMLAGLAYLHVEMRMFGPRRRALRATGAREREPESVRAVASAPRPVTLVEQNGAWYYDDSPSTNR